MCDACSVVTRSGLPIHFRSGSFPEGLPGVRLSGSAGEISLAFGRDGNSGWRLFQETSLNSDGLLTGGSSNDGPRRRLELPWPPPQLWAGWPSADAGLATYCVADVMDCLEGTLDEPKNSGRRVRMAMEAEIALKRSAAVLDAHRKANGPGGSGGSSSPPPPAAVVTLPFPKEARAEARLNFDWFR